MSDLTEVECVDCGEVHCYRVCPMCGRQGEQCEWGCPTSVVNGGTACGEVPLMAVGDLTVAASSLTAELGAVTRRHFGGVRVSEEERVDARAADMRFVPPNNAAHSAGNMIKPLSHWRSVGEVARELGEKLLAHQRECEERAARWAPPARAPFPARALRTRPWDLSALVE